MLMAHFITYLTLRLFTSCGRTERGSHFPNEGDLSPRPPPASHLTVWALFYPHYQAQNLSLPLQPQGHHRDFSADLKRRDEEVTGTAAVS